LTQSQSIKKIKNRLKTTSLTQFFIKEFYTILSILFNMAATSYDGTCKNCGSVLSVWIEIRKNIDGIPVPEVWCIECVRGNNTNITK
jgi:hypothetical protein